MAVITISRQFGAGGKTLADKLAARLAYDVAHEEIIERLAQSADLSPEGIRSFEVEDIDDIHNLPSGGFIRRLFEATPRYMEGQLYVKLLNTIIPQMADKGNLVILGRGAQFILKDLKETYHVLLLAEEADRIEFLRNRYELSSEEARQLMVSQGKRRLKLMKLFHSDDFDQPTHYDLVLNMSKMRIDTAVELICALVEPH